MKRPPCPRTAALAIALFACAAGSANAADRTAKEILKDLDKNPAVTTRSFKNQAEFDKFKETTTARFKLIDELFKVDRENKALEKLLKERFELAGIDQATMSAAEEEANWAIKQTENPGVKAEGLYFAAIKSLRTPTPKPGVPKAINDFLAAAPKDERGAELLYIASMRLGSDAKKEVCQKILADYPKSRYAESIKGELRRLESVGKPFELSFKDVVSGKTISIADLKNQVVVIDFWATWCGPCVAEMPNMKKLYAEYHSKGVEFIGVSLDQPEEDGGLDKLKKFVAEKEIAWPQYYQGNGWNSEFSKSWGINSIPCVFVVDPQGNLFSVEARGKLEELIPELLKKVQKDKGAAGGN